MHPRSVISKAVTMLTESVGLPINNVHVFMRLGRRSRATLGRVFGVTLILASRLQLLGLLLSMPKAFIPLGLPDLRTLLIRELVPLILLVVFQLQTRLGETLVGVNRDVASSLHSSAVSITTLCTSTKPTVASMMLIIKRSRLRTN